MENGAEETEVVLKDMNFKLKIPLTGMKFDTYMEAYEFYKQYAWKVGFGTQKNIQIKAKKPRF